MSMNKTLNKSEVNIYGNQRIDVAVSVMDAAYQTAKNYPGGAGRLAERMGLNPTTFRHQVSPSNKDNKLGLEDAVDMQVMSGDKQITHALCAALGGVFIEIDPNESGSSLAEVSKMISEFGESINEMQKASSDGVVTPNEMARCEKEVADLFAAANGALRSLRSMMPRRD